MGGHVPVGSSLTMTGLTTPPHVTVVGVAASATGTADAWVVPAQIPALRPPGTPATMQMLYRFRAAATDRAIRADVAALVAALPAGAVTTTQSYLSVKAHDTSRTAALLPFVGAFSVLGLVLSVLIVVNVVSGAVVAGYTRIGILKSIGFTPDRSSPSTPVKVWYPRPSAAWPAWSPVACWPTRYWPRPPSATESGCCACPPGSTWRYP